MKDDFEYHITFPIVNEVLFSNDPVVILFGWAGCSDRHLSKYSKIYEKQGYVTMRFVTSPSIMTPRMVNHKKIVSVAEKVVGLMEDMAFYDNPIFFHSFSNGGASVYRHISEILRKNHPGKYEIKGCIFDSTPAKVTAIGFLRAAIAVTQGNIVWKYCVAVFLLLQMIFLDLCNSFFQVFMGEFSRKRLWQALMVEPNICPQLFLFSKGDNICSWESIQEFVTKRRDMGVNVHTVIWDDSPHVQHMVFHEEAYCCAVCMFVKEQLQEDANEDIVT